MVASCGERRMNEMAPFYSQQPDTRCFKENRMDFSAKEPKRR